MRLEDALVSWFFRHALKVAYSEAENLWNANPSNLRQHGDWLEVMGLWSNKSEKNQVDSRDK